MFNQIIIYVSKYFIVYFSCFCPETFNRQDDVDAFMKDKEGVEPILRQLDEQHGIGYRFKFWNRHKIL